MKHTHKCYECQEEFDCLEEEISLAVCIEEMLEIESVPTCLICQGA